MVLATAGLAHRARTVLQEMQAGKVSASSNSWSKADTIRLFQCIADNGLDWNAVCDSIKGNKSKEDCLRRFETVLMQAEGKGPENSTPPQKKPATPKNRKRPNSAIKESTRRALIPKKEPIALPCGLERLTERQQLALLLQVTKEESQGNSKYQDEEEADTSDSSSQESDDDSETSSDTSDSSDSSASSGDGADRPPDYDSWTTAKKRRWNTMDESPNGTNKFYYNFVPPGVTLRTGAWSSEEARLFMYMLQAHPPMDAWGLFSMNIPGRTGQQCEAYHRKLQKQGKLVQNDPPSSLPRLKVQSVTSQSPSSSSRSRRTPSKEDPSTPRHSDGTSADSSSRSASSANLKKRQYTTPNAKDGPTMNLKSLMDSASDLPAATPPRGGNHHANSVNPDLTPDNPTQNNVTPKAPKGGRQAWKTRSRTEGHGGGMSPVKLVGMGEEGAKHKKSFQKVSTMETTEEDSLDAEESCHRPRKAKMVSKYASRHRSLAPTVPQSNDRSPSTPPFSSAILPPLSKKAKTTHIVGGGFDMESARLKRAYEIQTARLKEACERQLDQIRLKYDADEDERPTSSSFSFLDGCKSLLMMRKWAYDEDGPSMFEMPGSKEQMMKQSVQDYEDAMKGADRMHQIQMQALEALQREGVL